MASSFLKGLTIHLCAAGRRNYHDDNNDGCISAVVSLVIVFSVISGTTMVITYRSSEMPVIIEVTYGTLIILQFMGILSCLLIPLLKRLGNINIEMGDHALTPAIKIRLKFLCLFCLGCFLHFSYHVVCSAYSLLRKCKYVEKLKVTSDAVNIVYYPVQTIFLIVFAKYRMKPSLSVHYMLVLQMAPCISFWNLFLLRGLHESTRSSNNSSSGNCSITAKSVMVGTAIDRICVPTVVAFSLMVVLLLASIWPANNRCEMKCEFTQTEDPTGENIDKYTDQNHEEINKKSQNYGAIKSEESGIQVENTPKNMPKNVFKDKFNAYTIFFVGICVNVPLLVFAIFYYSCESTKHEMFKIVFHALAMFSKMLLFLFQAAAFSTIPVCCKIIKVYVSMFTLGNCLLVFGLWGYSFFQTINFISVIQEKNSPAAKMFLIHTFFSCLTAVQTTVFLLQMNLYEKKIGCSSKLKYFCVKLAGYLLTYWILDTFIESHGLLSTVQCYLRSHTYLVVSGRILFPFLIFFRFQNFLSLYEIYRKL